MFDPRTPILVGAGQITDPAGAPSSERSRVAFCAEAANLALEDTQAAIGGHALGHLVDAIAVMEFFSDISPRFASPYGRSSNPPQSVANRLHADETAGGHEIPGAKAAGAFSQMIGKPDHQPHQVAGGIAAFCFQDDGAVHN